jgi:hypothetical protein
MAFHIEAGGTTREEIGVTLGMTIYRGASPSVMCASHAFTAPQRFEAKSTTS